MLEPELKEARREKFLKSVPTIAEFPESADLLSQLKTRRKKSGVNLADRRRFWTY